MHLGCKAFIGGPNKTLFGDGTYSQNIMQDGVVLQPQDYLLDGITPLANCIVVTGPATVAPDATTGAAWFSCQNLVITGASASLTASVNCKGLIGVVKGKNALRDGATVHMTMKGKAGNFGNLTVFDLIPQSYSRKLKPALASYIVQGEGALGPLLPTTNLGMINGNAAAAMQTGSGGSGRMGYGADGVARAGKGGPCCGGAGGGGASYTSEHVLEAGAVNPGDYGGPGGSAGPTAPYTSGSAGGGAGQPPGIGSSSPAGSPGAGAGGGLIMLVCPFVLVGTGSMVAADGAAGGAGSNLGGGGAGGGCVIIITLPGGYTNTGTVRANGGAGGIANSAGGAGGAGSVNILTVS